MGTTTNYGWTTPTIGADADTWGSEINTTLGDIDAQVFLAAPLAAPTFSGLASFVSGTFSSTLGVTGVLTATGGLVGNVTGNLTGNITGDTTMGGKVSLSAGKVIVWNADAGISRAGAASLLIGNGTDGDQTGALAAAKFSTSSNANITSPGSGVMQVGTGTTTGAGGTLNAANFNGVIGATTPAAGTFTTVYATGLVSLTGGANIAPAATPATNSVGYLGRPVRIVTTSTTLLMADAGGCVTMNSASGTTVTIPPAGSVAFPQGTVIKIRNTLAGGTVTITRGSGVVLYKLLSNTSTDATLAPGGLCELFLESSNWVVSAPNSGGLS